MSRLHGHELNLPLTIIDMHTVIFNLPSGLWTLGTFGSEPTKLVSQAIAEKHQNEC